MSYSSIADYEERLKEVDERSESSEVVPYDIPQTIKKIESPQGMGDRGVDSNDRPIWARTKVSGDKPQTAVEKGTTLQYRIVRNGVEEAYEIPEHLQEKFERKYPDARIAYTVAGNNYLVPIWKREKFFKEYPDATAYLNPYLRHTGESAKGKALREQPDWPMASDTDMRRSLQESIAAVGKSLEERYDVLDKERADAEARQTGLGGFFYGAAQARRASLGMPDTFNPVYDKEYRQLTAANNLLGDTKELVEAVDKSGTFAGDALRGMRDGLFDPDTWTAGLLEMTDQVELLQAVEKAEKGERLTDAESALLDASALNYLINASYADQLSRGYKAGKVTAESLPFMLEMASNPASGIGRGLGGRIARAALKRGTSRFLGKAASWAGRAVGDVAGAAAMAATTGAARVGSDAVSRYIGSPDYDIDDDGNITFAGTYGGEDTWLSAFGKAFASTTIENHSEMAGEYFAPVGRLAKRAVGWIPGFKQARRFIDETGKGRIGTALKEFKRMTRWDGTMGEFAEEIIGGMENALIVGDQTLDAAEGTGVFNKDNLIDTFLGVALMGGFFGGAQITGYRNPKKRIRDKLDAAGRNGEHVFGVEGWQPVSQLAESFIASGTGMNTKRFRDFMSTMSKDQRIATIDYMGAIAEARGYANARAKTESEAASNPESEAAMSERLRKAYDTGSAYGGDISVLHTAWRNMGEVRSRLTEDELAMNDDDLAAYAMEPGNVARRKDITDYLESKNILQGGRDRFDDDAKAALEEKRKAFAKLANKDTGFVTLVETKEEGERAYVTAGALSADKDGNVLSGGNAIALVDENGGNKRMVAASGISKVLSMEDEAAYTAQERAASENAGQVYESMVSAPTMEELEASVRLGEETFLRTPGGATVKVDDVTGIDSSGNVVYVENVAGKKVPNMMPLADFVSMQEAYARSHAGDGRNAEENEQQRPADAQGVSGTSRQPEASSDILVPRDKDGNVLYDELLMSNPDEYARLYAEEFGEDAARDDMASLLVSIGNEIDEKRNELSSSTSADKRAKTRRELAHLESRRDALSVAGNGGIERDIGIETAKETEEKAEPRQPDDVIQEGSPLSENDTAAPVFEDMTTDEAVAMIESGLGADAPVFISDNIAQAEKRLRKAESRRSRATDFAKRVAENREIEGERLEARRVLDAWNAMSEHLAAIVDGREREIQRQADLSEGRDDMTESLRSDIEPQTMEELAAWVLSDRNVKIIPDSYYSETGYSPSDRRRLVGKLATRENGGMTIQEIGEMVESEALSRGMADYDGTTGTDANAGRNAVLSVLQSVETTGDIGNYIARRREEQAAALERENRNRLDALAYERRFANFNEMSSYDEWLQEEARRVLTSENYENYLTLLNEENSEEAYGTTGNGTQEGGIKGNNAGDGQGNIENDQGAVPEGGEHGVGLLQGERAGSSIGTGEGYRQASSVGNDTHETAQENVGRQAAGSLRVNEGVTLSPFAEEVANRVYDSLPTALKGRVSVRSSSTGDEPYEGFVQRYDIDGKPSKVYYVEPLDLPIDSSMGQYAIEDYNVDNPELLDEYSRLFREYMENKPSVEAYESDERGGMFGKFEDALDFLSFVDARGNDAGRSRTDRQGNPVDGSGNLFQYFTGSLAELISQSRQSVTKLIKKVIAPVSSRLKNDLAAKGVDIDDSYKHVIDNNAVRHILKKHSGKDEEMRGQIPISDADFENIAEVVESYDGVDVMPGDTSSQRIIYNKAYPDGTIVYVEERRTGRKELGTSG
mgnify:CR=1 FL=1